MNQHKEIVVTENDLVEMMLSNVQPHMVTMTDTTTIEQYNHLCSLFLFDKTITVETPDDETDKYNKALEQNWFMPDEYQAFDIENHLLSLAKTPEERQRIQQELELYKERDMIPVLKFLNYLVDILRQDKIVWGVGRGSSVASYILYLLGVHKIDSIKYELDYKEFFR